MTQEQDLLTGSVPKKLIRFAFPLFLANLLQALYNVVDMLVVGKIVGRHQQCLHAVLYHQFPLYRPDHGRERFGCPVQGRGRPNGTA